MFLLFSLASAGVLRPDSKVLICWYSRSGLTKRVVDVLQARLGADVHEITPGVSYNGIVGGARMVYHSLVGEEPPLAGSYPDVTKYDAFVIATPIWAFKPATPVAKFLSEVDFAGKPVIPLATCKSNARRFLDAFKKTLGPRGKFVSKEVFYDVGSKSDAVLAGLVQQWSEGL
jgi:flavodoxin